MSNPIRSLLTIGDYSFREVAPGVYREICRRCQGRGWMDEHAMVDEGRCFKCWTRGDYGIDYTADECHERCRRLTASRERYAAKKHAEHVAFIAEHAADFAAEAEARAAAEQARLTELEMWQYVAAEVGEKVTITGTVTKLISVDTPFGSSLLVVIEDAEQHIEAKAFTTAGWAYDAEVGQQYTVAGFVKGFETYEGRKSTMLARVKGTPA